MSIIDITDQVETIILVQDRIQDHTLDINTITVEVVVQVDIITTTITDVAEVEVIDIAEVIATSPLFVLNSQLFFSLFQTFYLEMNVWKTVISVIFFLVGVVFLQFLQMKTKRGRVSELDISNSNTVRADMYDLTNRFLRTVFLFRK